MFQNISKKLILSLVLWITLWIGIFISYAVDIIDFSQTINNWNTINTSWFNKVQNRFVNINDSWIYSWSINASQISTWWTASINITGTAATASSVPWTWIISLPSTIVGYGITDAPTKTWTWANWTWWIGITGNAATASGVPWTWLTGTIPNVSLFNNDVWYLTGASLADNRVNTTGDDITWNLNVSGNVGIGINSPWYKLDVEWTTKTNYLSIDAQDWTSEWGEIQLVWAWTNWNVQIDNNAWNVRVFTLASGKLFQVLGWSIYANGTADNYFWSNVGIGTTTPAYKLDVNWSIRAGSSAILSTGGSAGYYQDTVNGAYRSIVSSATTNGYYFQTNAGATTTMYVGLGWTYNGRVGIWTNAPAYPLHVVGSINSDSIRTWVGTHTYITLEDDESPNWVKHIHANSNNIWFLNGAWAWISRWDEAWIMFNTSSIYAPAFIYSSDKRLKTNIKPLENSKNILKIDPVRFDWIKDWKKDIWIIAQEVEKYFPEFVEIDDKWYKAVNYPKLVIPLMWVVQEQQEKIDDLEKRLKILEEKIK